MSKRPSLKSIADALGVSTTTVSWVVSGKGDSNGISLETQEKVREYAKALNYHPNQLAQNLRKGVTNTIGLVIPSIGDQFYAENVKVIELEAEKYGYTLTVCSSESDVVRESKMIRMLKEKQVDGLIIAPTRQLITELQLLVDEQYPFVCFDRYYPELESNYVIIDNELSSYKLVKHLIAKGCKKIAAITTNPHLLTVNKRVEGYKKALTDFGIDYDPNLLGMVEYNNYESEINHVLKEIIERNPDVDGFFFTTHILALEAFRYFYQRKIDFNNKFQFACIHSVPLMRMVAPNLSIAHMPIEMMGKEIVRLLVNNMNKVDNNEKRGIILSASMDLI